MKPLFLLLATLPIVATAVRAESTPPNFLIIFIDDMGYGDVGCFGGTSAQTPNIDQLAAAGMRLTSFYAQPLCGPSRGALMTGRYPIRIGGGWTTNADEITVAEILGEAGYATGCIGKWDMSQRRYQDSLVPNAQGFDHYFGTLGANDSGGVTLWHDRRELTATTDLASLSRLYTDKSIEFLRQHGKEPFFLYVAHTMMHVVIDASPAYRNRTGNGLYADTLGELDAETGRLLESLDDLGLRENTVVLFTSDNGPWSNDHSRQRAKNSEHVEWTKGPEIPWGSSGPLRGAKGSTWEGGLRVPAIVRWPGYIAARQTSDAIVSTLDVLPTFASLAGITAPADRTIDGVNQKDLLLGRNPAGARDRFFYYAGSELQAVRVGPWKLRLPNLERLHNWPEVDCGSQEAELYHLERDLGETKNVAADQPDVVARLKAIAKSASRS